MKTFSICSIIMLCGALPLNAQVRAYTLMPGTNIVTYEPGGLTPSVLLLDETETSGESSDKKSDPAYKMYKEAYNLILDEQWDDARKKLAEVVKQYPKSDYVDDAEYWSAVALKHIDRKKAKAAYEKFLAAYPKSNYYDDALADLANLGSTYTVTTSGNDAVVAEGDAHSYSYGIATSGRLADRQMRLAQQKMNRQLRFLTSAGTPRAPRALQLLPGTTMYSDETIDRETRLKMDALNAIGETKEDSLSYKTLRDVAVDRTQPRALRETAMSSLSNFHQLDVLPVFLEIAKKDTSEEIQNLAIDYMGQLSHNKNRSFETLMDLFYAIPKYRKEQMQTVLGSIAEIGNDRAIDFLAKVAKTHEDYDLRSDAVYYLGNIGGDKARAALYEILKGK